MVLYQFENDRKYDRASDYLEGFNGVIQSDGYQAYANIKDIKTWDVLLILEENW